MRTPSKVRAVTQALTRTYISTSSVEAAPGKGEKYTVKIVSAKGEKSSQSTMREFKLAAKQARKRFWHSAI